MAASRFYLKRLSAQERLTEELVDDLLPLQDAAVRKTAIDFVLYSLDNNRFVDTAATTVKASYDGMRERMLLHSQQQKAEALQRWTQRITGLRPDDEDMPWKVLRMLMCLAVAPLQAPLSEAVPAARARSQPWQPLGEQGALHQADVQGSMPTHSDSDSDRDASRSGVGSSSDFGSSSPLSSSSQLSDWSRSCSTDDPPPQHPTPPSLPPEMVDVHGGRLSSGCGDGAMLERLRQLFADLDVVEIDHALQPGHGGAAAQAAEVVAAGGALPLPTAGMCWDEDVLCEHSLMALQGVPSQVFPADADGGLSVMSGVVLPYMDSAALRSLLQPFAEAGSAMRGMQQLLGSYATASSQQLKKGRPADGRSGASLQADERLAVTPTTAALAQAVQQQVDALLSTLLALQERLRDLQAGGEALVQCGHGSGASLPCQRGRLLWVRAATRHVGRRVRLLANTARSVLSQPIASAASQPASPAEVAAVAIDRLCDCIRRQHAQGSGCGADCSAQRALLHLLAEALAPTLQSLELWILEGRLHDPAQEFFIEPGPGQPHIQAPRWWATAFRLRRRSASHPALPACPLLLQAILPQLLAAGKYVQLLSSGAAAAAADAAAHAPPRLRLQALLLTEMAAALATDQLASMGPAEEAAVERMGGKAGLWWRALSQAELLATDVLAAGEAGEDQLSSMADMLLLSLCPLPEPAGVLAPGAASPPLSPPSSPSQAGGTLQADCRSPDALGLVPRHSALTVVRSGALPSADSVPGAAAAATEGYRSMERPLADAAAKLDRLAMLQAETRSPALLPGSIQHVMLGSLDLPCYNTLNGLQPVWSRRASAAAEAAPLASSLLLLPSEAWGTSAADGGEDAQGLDAPRCSPHSMPLEPLMQRCLADPLSRLCSQVAEKVVSRLRGEWGLLKELRVLRSLYLLSSPATMQWASACVRTLSRISLHPPDHPSLPSFEALDLDSALQEALASADSMHAEQHLPRHAAVELQEPAGGGDGGKPQALAGQQLLERLSVRYSVAWPLTLVVQDTHLAAYEDILRFLLQLLWARHAAAEAKMLLCCAARARTRPAGRAAPLLAPHQRWLSLCVHQMLHAAEAVQDFILLRMQLQSWAQLEDCVQQAQTLDQVFAGHERYLQALQAHCFLQQTDRSLIVVGLGLRRLLECITSFCIALPPLLPAPHSPASPPARAAPPHLRSLWQSFLQQRHWLLQLLLHPNLKVVKAFGLDDLALLLDFNGTLSSTSNDAA